MKGVAPIVYFDIAGPDHKKLQSFYADTFGWTIDGHGAVTHDSTGGTPA